MDGPLVTRQFIGRRKEKLRVIVHTGAISMTQLMGGLGNPPQLGKVRQFGRRSRRERQRGAEMLEVALISTLLFGLTFLLVDLSLAICVRSTLQHAVREGVRYAITGQNSPGPCQDDSIKAVVKKNSLGFMSKPSVQSTLHVHF